MSLPPPPALRRRDVLLAGACLALGLACVRLGIWQLDRLSQRRARNAQIESRTAQAPIPLPGEKSEPEEIAYRRVSARGSFDLARQIVLINRARDGVPGVHLVAPLKLIGSEAAILVDRGWIPAEQIGPEDWAAYDVEGEIEILGLLRLSHEQPRWTFLRDPISGEGEPPLGTWRLLHIPGIASQMPYPLRSVYLEQLEALPGDPQPIPDPDLDLSQGPHLSYAIQWFAFAAIAWGGGLAWIRHRLRGGVSG